MIILFHPITCNYTLKYGYYTAFHVWYIVSSNIIFPLTWKKRTAYSGLFELNKLQQYHYIYVIRLLFNDSKHHSLCRNTQIYFMAYACRSAERFNGMYGCS